MPTPKGENEQNLPILSSWIKSEEAKRAISGALERSQEETKRLKDARAIDPKKLEEVITH